MESTWRRRILSFIIVGLFLLIGLGLLLSLHLLGCMRELGLLVGVTGARWILP